MTESVGRLERACSEGGIVAAARICLLGGFRLELDNHGGVNVPSVCQRLAACVALRAHSVMRHEVSILLWPDEQPKASLARIRWGLWRLRQLEVDVLAEARGALRLAPGVTTDLQDAICVARQIIDGGGDGADVDALNRDLLPLWDDEWIGLERERFRQLRLHALEVLCKTLSADGRFAHAVDAGIEAVAAEPLRESAHRALIEVHLREGNGGEALRQCERYSTLAAELGVLPSPRLVHLADLARAGMVASPSMTAEASA
jgi:DNA-binding SARP family transcriptional activator